MPSQQPLSLDLFAEFSRHLPSCWQRDRGTLRPAHVFYAIMSIAVTSTHGYRQVLDYLKRTVGERLGWVEAPYPSSFSDARRKLSPEQCKEVFSFMRQRASLLSVVPKVRYGGRRLLAVDMTTLALPAYASVKSAFSSPIDSKGKTAKAPQATLTVMWDVGTNTPFDWRLEACYSSERFAAYDMLGQLGSNDLLLADRGYPSRRMLHDIEQRGATYLIRLPLGKAGGFREARAFALDDSQWDSVVGIHEDRARTGEPTLQVRLMKFRLPSGEIAVFATNLRDEQTIHERHCALCTAIAGTSRRPSAR